jgi:EAL domain-containing protein (putative c-di-GMP-specific phosphodiesterase class I)
VETPEQLQTLRNLGEIEVQGYLLSPPVPIGEFQQLLEVGKQRSES